MKTETISKKRMAKEKKEATHIFTLHKERIARNGPALNKTQ